MIAEQLKKSILQAAIQGKLTQQLPEDGDARDLQKEIKKEKARLIKDGKIKKEKPLPEITEDEIPFEIPENWCWVRFGFIFSIGSASRVHQKDWRTSGVPFYRAREIAKLSEQGYVDNELFIDNDFYEKLKTESGVPKIGDLMVTGVGTLGKTYIVNENDQFYYKDASVLCVTNLGNINPNFFKYFMESQFMMDQINSNSSGTTVSTLTISRFGEYLFSLPPLSEQERIVEQLNDIFMKINKLKNDEVRLEELQKSFPKKMKDAILQYAIQGKLTKQLPEDGDAKDLLKEIQTEKEKLIKEGKINKEKSLPKITEDEIPFEIPENWCWVRFGNLVNFRIGKTPQRNNGRFWGQDYHWVSIADMKPDGLISETKEKISGIALNEVFKKTLVPAGTLLMSFKLTIGRVSILDINAVHNEAIISILPYKNEENIARNYYFKILPLISTTGNFKSAIKGKTLNSTSINNLLIPLPPLAEQKRIVARIEELLPLCEELSSLES